MRPFVWKVSVVIGLFLGGIPAGFSADKNPTLVMFTTSWCASCREVMPQVKTLAAEKGYGYQTIDLDSDKATAEAKQHGISLTHLDPPQVYWIGSNGHPVVRLLDANVNTADPAIIQTRMRQQLPQ